MSDLIFEKNMAALEKHNPDIADYIKDLPKETPNSTDEADISAGVTDVAGKTILYVTKNDNTYRLDSLYDPKQMLELWFKGLGEEWNLNCKFYMFGLGNGLFVRKFLKSARNDCVMFVHEPSYKVFKTALENFDLSDIFEDKRVKLIFSPLYDQVALSTVYLELMDYTDIYAYKAGFYPNYPDLFPKEALEFAEGIQRARDHAGANQIVHDRFGGDFNRNTFNNLVFLRESKDIEKLADSVPEGIPAIIVAAGPSLDKNINEIRKAKGKSIIISTDTALKPLSLAGIVPDIAAIMDGKKDERYLSEADSRMVPLACTPRCGTEFLHLHTGFKFFTDDFCNHLNAFIETTGKKMERLSSGGSVANDCFSLARMFHSDTIIMMGQDLAYTGDKTHSVATVRGSVKTEIEDLEHVVMDVDIDGNPVRSSKEFRLYREWFEKQIAENPDLTVIDATEGGVRIAGSILMTARDAIERYCTSDFDFGSLISNASPLFDDEIKLKFDDYIRKVPAQMKELRRIIRETLADYRSMRRLVENNNYHGSQMKKLYDSCQKQTKKIESSPVIEYVHNQLQEKSSELLDNVNKLEKEEKQELLTVCDIGEKYLQDMDEAVTELEPYMEIIKRDFMVWPDQSQ